MGAITSDGRPNERAVRWTRSQQLVAVTLSHVAILAFVLILIEVLNAEPATPGLFVSGELAVIIVCGWPMVNTKPVREMLMNLGFLSRGSEATNARLAMIEQVAGGALFIAFVLQLGALIPLLRDTGGPIHSPFAPMAVAIAAFTPFLANYSKTVGIVTLLTVVYYVAIVGIFDDLDTQWAYLAVNVSILALSSALTLGDIRRRGGEVVA
jgi:hypothetical protein